MKIALIYNKGSEHTTGVYIENIIKDADIAYQHFWTSKSDQIPKEFDLYFRVDHGDYKFDIPEDLRPVVFYIIDTHLKKPYKKIKRQVGHYDVVFCAQKEGAEKLKKETGIDTQWAPLGCDPGIHKKLNIEKKYDIGFVGSDARKFPRGKLIDSLRKKYSQSFLGGIDFRKMCEIYSASRIGFNYSILNDINMRIFEIMSCGAFLLTNQIRDNGFNELFEDGKHLLVYKSKKQLLELINYYLANEAERESIAQAGFRLVTQKHTYYHRVQAMFNYIAFKFGAKYNDLRI